MRKGSMSFSEWCKREGKTELLALYDPEENDLPPSEVPFSSPKKYKFRCPSCGISWLQSLNKLNRLRKGNYNVIAKRAEETFCPYCKGERLSPQYNLATSLPGISEWWDKTRNSKPPEALHPSTHQKFYLTCPDCGYSFPAPVRIADLRGFPRCPQCGDGKAREVTPLNCLEALHPEIAKELDVGRNNGITGKMILPSSKENLWFICSIGHRYRARVSNRTHRNHGCSVCDERRKTSFPEQAIRFYLQKCSPDLQSRQVDPYTDKSVDILLPSRKTAVEFNSLYYHSTIDRTRCINADLSKIYALIRHYRVYIIAEKGAEPPVKPHPLIQVISAPVFAFTNKVCLEYDHLIYELLQLLFPERDSYPNINIMRDHLLILQQYINAAVPGSFEETHPLLAADWASAFNGILTPSMFPPNSPYKFFWKCRSCGKIYRASMANRQKINPDTCPHCCRKSRYKSPLLIDTYPFLKAFWCPELNPIPLSQISVASEKFGIFELPDGRIVPARISNLSAWLHYHSAAGVEQYFDRLFKIDMDRFS